MKKSTKMSNLFYDEEWHGIEVDGVLLHDIYRRGKVIAFVGDEYTDFFKSIDWEEAEMQGVDKTFLEKLGKIEMSEDD